MSFQDYSLVPADNTALGDGTYIGPNMLRNKVRPALQQIAADGKELADQVALISGQLQLSGVIAHDAPVSFNMYALSEAGHKTMFLLEPPDAGSHIGTTHGGLSIEHRPSGSGVNGPTSGDYALRLSSVKSTWPSSSTIGEIGAIDISVRQTNGDCSGMLVNVQNTLGAGDLFLFEGTASQIDMGAGAAYTYNMQVQMGVISHLDAQYGFHAWAVNGTPTNAFLARSGGSAIWDNVFTYVKDSTTLFNVDGSGQMTVGSFTGNADAAVTGYVTIRTVDNVLRKLAVIA